MYSNIYWKWRIVSITTLEPKLILLVHWSICDLNREVLGGDPVPTTDTDRQVVFGDQVTCSITLKDTSVVAEDAEDMSFKETCSKAQYEEVVKESNT